jgi:hypothetical protein
MIGHYKDIQYRESQFNRKDYHRLYEIASSPFSSLKSRIAYAAYRDKRFQRVLTSSERQIFYCTLKEVPIMMGRYTDDSVQDIARWRLDIAK